MQENRKISRKAIFVSPLFFGGGGAQKHTETCSIFSKNEFSKSSKLPMFIAFPAKVVGGGHFFQKRPMLKGGDF